jgi:hypothetical protein
MEFEILKKKLILEAHNHFVAVSRARPYVEFGNFVESLRRDDNATLIESIQKGVLAIIEGEFQNENDPGRKLLRQAEEVTPEQLNQFIENNDVSQLAGLLYPFIIQTIDKANFANTNTADKVFAKAVGNLPDAIGGMKPMTSGTPAAYLANYSNNFLTGPLIKDAKQPAERGQVTKSVDVNPEEGNTAQGWEYVDPEKRVGAKKYGKALDRKNVEEGGTLVPKILIKWKGLKDKAGKWKVKPMKEWVSEDEVRPYNITDQEVFSTDSISTPVGDGTIEDTIGGSSDFSDKDMTSDILKMMDSKVDALDADDNIKKAVKKFFKQSTVDPKLKIAAKKLEYNLLKAVKANKLPRLKDSGKINPKYDSWDKVEAELKYLDDFMTENTPAKIKTLADEAGISAKVLTRYIDMAKDAAMDDQALWDKRSDVLEPDAAV